MQTKDGCQYWVACMAGKRRVAKVGKRHFVTHANKEFCPLRWLGNWEREIFIGFILWLFSVFRGFFAPLVCYLCSRIIHIQPVNLLFKLAEVNCFLSCRVKSWLSPLLYCLIYFV